MQTVEPGEQTAVHYHDCEELIVIKKGTGQLQIDLKEDEILIHMR